MTGSSQPLAVEVSLSFDARDRTVWLEPDPVDASPALTQLSNYLTI